MSDKNSLTRLVDIFVDAINFIVLSYLLACGMLSFKTSPLWILLIATNTYVISKYYIAFKKYTSSTTKSILIIVACIMILAIILLTTGYFPISTIAKKLI